MDEMFHGDLKTLIEKHQVTQRGLMTSEQAQELTSHLTDQPLSTSAQEALSLLMKLDGNQ